MSDEQVNQEVLHSGIRDVISTGNSTTEILLAGILFTGSAVKVINFGGITILAYADVAGAIQSQFSDTGKDADWYVDQTFPVLAGTSFYKSISAKAKYFRLVYANGVADQTDFLIHTILKKEVTTPIPEGTNTIGGVVVKDEVTDISMKVNPEGQAHIVDSGYGVPSTFTKQTASGEKFTLQKGQLNNLRLRQQIQNEHAESSRNIQSVVTADNIVGQIFRASQDNINGINLTLESAAGVIFDDFESYADDAALQAAWIATGDLADVEVDTVYEGSQSMYLPAAGNTGDEWAKAVSPAIDFTGYTGEFQMYSNKEYKDVKMRVFVEDSLGNTASRQIVQANKNVWTKLVVATDSLIDDGAATDITDIVKIGFRVEKEKKDGFVILDILISVPGPGSVELKLWDMGATLPTSGAMALNGGTQYTKLGDLGITGDQVASVSVDMLGGKRGYHIDEFVAGVALEIPTNELLTPDNYYAITLHYVDTDVSVYGPNEAWDDYYENGYAFSTPDEATNITALGSQKDLMFIVFSTQPVYVFEITTIADAPPNGSSETSLYIEDIGMKRTNTLVSAIKAVQEVTTRMERPFLMGKGAKLEQEYNDDISDDVSSINLVISYYFEPPEVHG